MCVQCSKGEYASEIISAYDRCFECIPRTHQPDEEKSGCIECLIGSFQIKFHQSKCGECGVGGFCDATDRHYGGFTSCPAGTYNDKTGQTNATACQPCPTG